MLLLFLLLEIIKMRRPQAAFYISVWCGAHFPIKRLDVKIYIFLFSCLENAFVLVFYMLLLEGSLQHSGKYEYCCSSFMAIIYVSRIVYLCQPKLFKAITIVAMSSASTSTAATNPPNHLHYHQPPLASPFYCTQQALLACRARQ